MKAQEAIERIKWRKWTASQMVGMGEDGKAFEDFDMAIEALEKQDAKKYKTFVGESGIVRITYYECPCCGEIGIEHMQKHCHECGQKIQWGE